MLRRLAPRAGPFKAPPVRATRAPDFTTLVKAPCRPGVAFCLFFRLLGLRAVADLNLDGL